MLRHFFINGIENSSNSVATIINTNNGYIKCTITYQQQRINIATHFECDKVIGKNSAKCNQSATQFLFFSFVNITFQLDNSVLNFWIHINVIFADILKFNFKSWENKQQKSFYFCIYSVSAKRRILVFVPDDLGIAHVTFHHFSHMCTSQQCIIFVNNIHALAFNQP